EAPQIAVALIVENGGWGSTVAAPIARNIFDFWLDPERVEARRLADLRSYEPDMAMEAGEEGDAGESPDAMVAPEDMPPVGPEQNEEGQRGTRGVPAQPPVRIQLRGGE
ncbi:MAG: hypothetical protein WCX93_14560, partial [Burkholderiaceae bacterium]